MRASPLSVGFVVLALLGFAAEEARAGEEDTRAAGLYGAYCASCHGADRFGGSGPALLPESLGRLGNEALIEVIGNGRPATQMRGFAGELALDDIAALAHFLASAPAEPPLWELADMQESHVILDAGPRPERPVFEADPLNLFVVVEAGDHHITILDGERFEPLARLPTHIALHGGPKFSPDGRFVYVASRDGWITKFDLYGLKAVAEIRAGLNTRNLALSGDGQIVAVANDLPRTLVFLDAADLLPIGVLSVQGLKDKTSSRLAGVYQARPRESFIAALRDVPEVWEIPYGKDAEPVFGGLVHSYEAGMVEGLPEAAGSFPVRRMDTGTPLDDFVLSPDYRLLIGSSRASGSLEVIHLDTRQVIAELALPGLPHLGSGITWMRQGRRVLATPDLDEPVVSVIDMQTWQVIVRIPTLGPGFFLRSHENTPYAWVDGSLGPQPDTLQVIDKETLKVVANVTPAPGQTAAHVEFTRDGRFALVSVMERDGAVVVYDAKTLKEIKRIAMVKPSGKYNVYNKIALSEGTSH